MPIKKRYAIHLMFFLALSTAITVLIYIVGGLSYSSSIGSTYQSRIKVELIGLIENTRYSLRFGKYIGTFYRMNEILAKQVASSPDIEGLYVLDKEGRELFATDGRELSQAVRALTDDYRAEGDQFYASMYLTEDGSARLVARCTNTAVHLSQSNFFYHFLLFSIIGLAITLAIIFCLVHRAFANGSNSPIAPAIALLTWIIIASGVMHYGIYRDYSDSVAEIEHLVIRSVKADFADLEAKGIGANLLLPTDSYFERYTRAIREVSAVTADEKGHVTVTLSPFIGRTFLFYLLETLCFMLIAAAAIRLFAKRLDRLILKGDNGTGEFEPSVLLLGKDISIRKKLRIVALTISAAALISVSTVGILAMMEIRSESEAALLDATKGQLTDIVNDKANRAGARLSHYAEHAAAFASLAQKPEILRATIAAIRNNSDNDIFDLYYGDEKGNFTLYDDRAGRTLPPGFDCRNTQWYSLCKKNRQVVFTDIYEDIFGGGKMITCVAPVYDEAGDFIGVFGIDILISDLYEELISLDMGKTAYAFLLNSKGKVITPSGEELTLEEAEGLDEEIGMRLQSSNHTVFERGGIFYTGAKVENTGWTVCIHAPAGRALSVVPTIDNEIVTVIIIFLFIFALILLIVFGIVTRVAAGITNPIIALSADVAKISGGNLSHRARVSTHDEVGKLAQSFNDMSDSLRDYIENMRRMTAEQEHIRAELKIAADIQASMLPTDFPQRNEFRLYASMTPAREVGGDFYDFFFIDPEHLCLVMADVSGKGMPAALFMVVAKTLIKNCAVSGAGPAEILYTVNNQLCENNDQFLFVTCWIGILDLKTRTLATADAGHEYPALRRNSSACFELLEAEHYPPLGTMEENTYEEFSLSLQEGDTLYLYTDGVTDARNPAGEKLSLKRMKSFLDSHGKDEPVELIKHIKADIAGFIGSAEPFDDITMMCLKYYG